MADNPNHLEHRGGCHISATPVQESILRTEMETRADDSTEKVPLCRDGTAYWQELGLCPQLELVVQPACKSKSICMSSGNLYQLSWGQFIYLKNSGRREGEDQMKYV